MPRATDAQVQQFVNERVRVRSEQLRTLLAQLLDDVAACDDVYEHVSGANGIAPTWTDERTDAPPHLLTPGEVGNYIAYANALIPHIRDAANYSTIQDACVRPVGG